MLAQNDLDHVQKVEVLHVLDRGPDPVVEHQIIRL